MLTALVLVCSLTMTPDLAGCDRGNAVDIMPIPEEFANPAACFMLGQAYLAQSEIGRDLSADERVKIVCAPSETVSAQPATGKLR